MLSIISKIYEEFIEITENLKHYQQNVNHYQPRGLLTLLKISSTSIGSCLGLLVKAEQY